MRITDKVVALVLVGSFALLVAPPLVAQERPQQYFIAATTGVTLSLPASSSKGQNLYLDTNGKWAPLPGVRESAGVLTFTLSPAQLAGGKTIVLLGKPDWLVAEDAEPPKVTRALVDGREVAPSGETNLGWLEAAPQTFELFVADTQNPLDPNSICAHVGARTVRAGSPGLEFLPDPKDSKKGRIVCSLPRLGSLATQGAIRIVIQCDDFAPDLAECRAAFTFTVMQPPEIDLDKPPATTPDGIKIFVDTSLPGYENVECLLDGKLQTPGTTTYGPTWASAETPVAHWFCLVLPKPRKVSGIEISWANYQGTFWASDRYAIMTWDGKQWANALRISNNTEAQTSSHSFAPRTTDRILVWVPPGGNHPQRPDLMWVTEVKLLP